MKCLGCSAHSQPVRSFTEVLCCTEQQTPTHSAENSSDVYYIRGGWGTARLGLSLGFCLGRVCSFKHLIWVTCHLGPAGGRLERAGLNYLCLKVLLVSCILVSPLAGQTYSQGWSAVIAKHDQGVFVTGGREGVTIRN